MTFVNTNGTHENKLAGEISKDGEHQLYTFDVKRGSYLMSNVVDIEEIYIEGFAAPLTSSGTLVANGVLVSNYARIKSQTLGDISMWPLKTFKWL